MVRLIICFLVLCFIAGCKRDWTNVVLEKRLYKDGYYFHVPDKKYTPQKPYVPPVPYPTVTVTIPQYKVATPDSMPVFYPQPYTPPPVFVYTLLPDTADGIAGGGMMQMNDSIPKGNFATDIVMQPDSAADQLLPQDTLQVIVDRDTMLIDTLNEFIVHGKYKNKLRLNGETDGFFQLGMIAGTESHGYPVQLNSFSVSMGMRYKIKINTWDKLALDFGYRFHKFSIDQEKQKAFPLSTAAHDREKIAVNSFSLGISNRIIYRRAEEKFAYWLDLGVYGDAAFRTSNVYVDVVNDASSPVADKSKVTTENLHLNYLNKFNYGVTVRAGWNRYSCFASWRLSDLIKRSSTEHRGDLPALVIGVEVNLGDMD